MRKPKPIKSWRVRWEIDIEATGPLHAALEALSIQRDRNSIALFFEVRTPGGKWVNVDLLPKSKNL